MNFLNFSKSIKYLFLFFFTVCSILGVHAQSHVVSVVPLFPGSKTYNISTSGLNSDDLVFYRFSDGHDRASMVTSFVSNANITRTFKTSSIKVSAYIARKNGPIGFASTTTSGLTVCNSCPLPSNLPNGSKIAIRPSSWDPFDDASMAAPFTDNTISSPFPAFNAPTTPWFILPISLKPDVAGYSEISLPSGVTLMGVFVKSKFLPFFESSGAPVSTQGDPHVASVTYLPNNVKINFGSTLNEEFNVYLVLKNSTTYGTIISFTSSLLNASGAVVQNGNSVSLVTKHVPHDPNHFLNFEEGVTGATPEQQHLRYRIDFQNLGAGDAEEIAVKAYFDPSLIYNPINLSSITSSHPISFYGASDPSTIGFMFTGINLVGLEKDPQPNIQDTKGWVEFTLLSDFCLPQPMNHKFTANASVTFNAYTVNFSETIETNLVKQRILFEPGPPCGGTPSETSSNSEASWSNDTENTRPRCYPSLFDDMLNIEYQGVQEDGSLRVLVTDLNGKQYVDHVYALVSGQVFNATLETQAMPKGMYLVHFSQGDQHLVQKTIKL